MDKNMIHIDELVRSRLQGGEEKERAGGWMAMRDLLDKEMPEVVAATGNRRLYGLLLLLLIGSSLTVCGYQLAIRNGGDDAHGTVLASAATSAAMPDMATRRAEANDALNNISPANNSVASNTTANSYKNVSNSSTITSGNPSQRNSLASGAIPGNNQRSNAAQSSDVQQLNRNVNNSNSAVHPVAADNNSSAVAMVSPAGKGPSAPLAEDGTVTALVKGTQVVTPDGLHLLLRRDSIQRIEIVQHRSRGMHNDEIVTPVSLSYDTISMAMLTVYKPVAPVIVPAATAVVASQPSITMRKKSVATSPAASMADAPVVAKNNNVIPVAAPKPDLVAAALNPAAAIASPATADDGNNLVSLSSLKTSSVKHSWWNPEQFNEVVTKMKFKMSGIEWYGGAEAGINGSFGNGHSLGGFQCALTGLIAINEMLSLNTGLYFYQRYNTGSTVHDNYVEVDHNSIHYSPVIIGNISYNRYSWTEDSIDHHFNYDVMRTLELPILLRISPGGRFFGEAGVNLVYGFKTSASEITNHAEQPVTQTQSYPTTQADPHFGSLATVKLDDFGSRLGLGFAIGGGYHFSPAVTLNLRVSKTMWDNAKSEGSQKISQDLFRLPNMQLSVGYRFSQQKASKSSDR